MKWLGCLFGVVIGAMLDAEPECESVPTLRICLVDASIASQTQTLVFLLYIDEVCKSGSHREIYSQELWWYNNAMKMALSVLSKANSQMQDYAKLIHARYKRKPILKDKEESYTAILLAVQPPGPFHAHIHNPQAIQTLTLIAQNVGA